MFSTFAYPAVIACRSLHRLNGQAFALVGLGNGDHEGQATAEVVARGGIGAGKRQVDLAGALESRAGLGRSAGRGFGPAEAAEGVGEAALVGDDLGLITGGFLLDFQVRAGASEAPRRFDPASAADCRSE